MAMVSYGSFATIDVPRAISQRTFVYGINDSGQIVGTYESVAPLGNHGFLATPIPEPRALSVLAGLLWPAAGNGFRAVCRRSFVECSRVAQLIGFESRAAGPKIKARDVSKVGLKMSAKTPCLPVSQP
jgi:hypothetical protein